MGSSLLNHVLLSLNELLIYFKANLVMWTCCNLTFSPQTGCFFSFKDMISIMRNRQMCALVVLNFDTT